MQCHFLRLCHMMEFHICKKCDKTVRNNCISCQVVCNIMFTSFLPKEFGSIMVLERVLVSSRILFKKISIKPKGKLPKIKGSVCNIPVIEIDDNCKLFPRPAYSDGLLIVKLKRKSQHPSHVLFEPDHFLLEAFQVLKAS